MIKFDHMLKAVEATKKYQEDIEYEFVFAKLAVHPRSFAQLKKDSDFNSNFCQRKFDDLRLPYNFSCGASLYVNSLIPEGAVYSMINDSFDVLYAIACAELNGSKEDLIDVIMNSVDVLIVKGEL